MIKRETINGAYFVAQTTYYVYRCEDDCLKDLRPPFLTTSSEESFEMLKNIERHNAFIKTLPSPKKGEILEYKDENGDWKEFSSNLLDNVEFKASEVRIRRINMKETSNFDPEKPCYCSACQRTYKNYKRFCFHMKRVHFKQLY